jgi:hypothetical protein
VSLDVKAQEKIKKLLNSGMKKEDIVETLDSYPKDSILSYIKGLETPVSLDVKAQEKIKRLLNSGMKKEDIVETLDSYPEDSILSYIKGLETPVSLDVKAQEKIKKLLHSGMKKEDIVETLDNYPKDSILRYILELETSLKIIDIKSPPEPLLKEGIKNQLSNQSQLVLSDRAVAKKQIKNYTSTDLNIAQSSAIFAELASHIPLLIGKIMEIVDLAPDLQAYPEAKEWWNKIVVTLGKQLTIAHKDYDELCDIITVQRTLEDSIKSFENDFSNAKGNVEDRVAIYFKKVIKCQELVAKFPEKLAAVWKQNWDEVEGFFQNMVSRTSRNALMDLEKKVRRLQNDLEQLLRDQESKLTMYREKLLLLEQRIEAKKGCINALNYQMNDIKRTKELLTKRRDQKFEEVKSEEARGAQHIQDFGKLLKESAQELAKNPDNFAKGQEKLKSELKDKQNQIQKQFDSRDRSIQDQIDKLNIRKNELQQSRIRDIENASKEFNKLCEDYAREKQIALQKLKTPSSQVKTETRWGFFWDYTTTKTVYNNTADEQQKLISKLESLEREARTTNDQKKLSITRDYEAELMSTEAKIKELQEQQRYLREDQKRQLDLFRQAESNELQQFNDQQNALLQMVEKTQKFQDESNAKMKNLMEAQKQEIQKQRDQAVAELKGIEAEAHEVANKLESAMAELKSLNIEKEAIEKECKENNKKILENIQEKSEEVKNFKVRQENELKEMGVSSVKHAYYLMTSIFELNGAVNTNMLSLAQQKNYGKEVDHALKSLCYDIEQSVKNAETEMTLQKLRDGQVRVSEVVEYVYKRYPDKYKLINAIATKEISLPFIYENLTNKELLEEFELSKIQQLSWKSTWEKTAPFEMTQEMRQEAVLNHLRNFQERAIPNLTDMTMKKIGGEKEKKEEIRAIKYEDKLGSVEKDE